MSSHQNPWFVTRLFDFSFSRFIATTLIRIVYVVLMIAGLAGIAFGLFKLFQLSDTRTAVLACVASPIAYLIYLVFIRLLCETLIVVFAIAEDMEDIRQALAEQTKTPPGQGSGSEPFHGGMES